MAPGRCLVALLALSLAGGEVCRGQGMVVGGVMGGFAAGSDGGVKNQPYFLTRKTTTVQKLADGTTITRSGGSTEARDSMGRTAVTTKFEQPMGGVMPVFEQTSVTDPVARTVLNWSSQGKQANLVHLNPPQTPQVRMSAPVRSQAASTGETPVVQVKRPQTARPEFHTEQLGAKTIAGVYAVGTRTTTTYPVGYLGNDRPLVTVNEMWRAPDLNITVLQMNDDPRSGVQTTEVTELSRAEPDPKLFQTPEGYTVKEQTQGSNVQ